MEAAFRGLGAGTFGAIGFGSVAVIATLFLLLRGGSPGVEVARAVIPSDPDHFLCYKADFVKPNNGRPARSADANVRLRDQFSAPDRVRHTVMKPKFFCNPTEKTHGALDVPITAPNTHLTAYKLDGRTPRHRLHVVNQFEDPEAEDPPNLVTKPKKRKPNGTKRPNRPLLLTPTAKEPHGPPERLEHYKCYKAKKGDEVNVSVFLRDQFSPGLISNSIVREAKYLCNPAEKKHGDQVFPIVNSDEHLVCYIVDGRTHGEPRLIQNQFQFLGMIPVRAFLLCTPSKKFHVGATAP